MIVLTYLLARSLIVGALPPRTALEVSAYKLALTIDPTTSSLSGRVDIDVTAHDRVDVVVLDLRSTMRVSAVAAHGKRLKFTHAADRLRVSLRSPLRYGRHLRVTVRYDGTPVGDGFQFQQHDGIPMVASYGLPHTAREWWPCFDSPDIKARSAEITVTVPRGLVAASNGLLRRHTRTPRTETWVWRTHYPIYADVISVAVTDYVTFSLVYKSMPLQFFLYPADLQRAKNDFSILPDMMAHHAGRFGEYPFIREKYGVAEFAIRSFREHQTLPSFAAELITGEQQHNNWLAHELAHQWFGNSLTVRDWSHIWLNESFSTYAWALWEESRHGRTAYVTAMTSLDREFTSPVLVTGPETKQNLFNDSTFCKGAWVLHMLRHVIGDDRFFRSLKTYVAKYRYGNVVTDDFRHVCEREVGRPLAWFFDEWLSLNVRPEYAVDWQATPTVTKIRIRQTQPGTVITMPLDVLVRTDDGEHLVTIWNGTREQDVLTSFASPVHHVSVDPNGWVLKRMDLPNAAADDLPR